MMLKNVLNSALVAIAVLAGCSSENRNESPTLQELGVTELEVVETESQLTIRGLTAANEVVASLVLEVGRFVMEDRGEEVDGRRMQVKVLDRTLTHESEGRRPLMTLPFPRNRVVGRFMVDPAVARVLARWQVGVEAEPVTDVAENGPADETPYAFSCDEGQEMEAWTDNVGCSESSYGGCASVSKKRSPKDGMYQEFRCCYTQNIFAERACDVSDPGENGCQHGDTFCGCQGPNGCAVCWNDNLAPGDPYCSVRGSGISTCKAEYCVW
jgi:hypothetical protein